MSSNTLHNIILTSKKKRLRKEKLRGLVEQIILGRQKNACFINPAAGNSNHDCVSEEVRNRLGNERFEFYESQGKKGITRDASKYLAENKGLIVVIGGDGTYNEVVNAEGDLEQGVIVLIPNGTSSDSCRSVNTYNPERVYNVVNSLLNNRIRNKDYDKYIIPCDLMKITYDKDRVVRAINSFSLGFSGELCSRVETGVEKNQNKARLGGVKKKTRYVSEALKLYKQGYEPFDTVCSFNNDSVRKGPLEDLLTIFVMNGTYAGSNMRFNPENQLNDGYLEGLFVRNMSKASLIHGLEHVFLLKDNAHIDKKIDLSNPEEHIIHSANNNAGLEYNQLNTCYVKGIESIEMNILEPESGKDYYFEVDGEPHRIDNPGAPIRVEVMPWATNVLRIPSEMPPLHPSLRIFHEINSGYSDF